MPGPDSTSSQTRATRSFSPEQQAERYRALLREAKLRVTAVRMAILRLLEESHEALNAQQVFERVGGTDAHGGGGKSGKSGAGGAKKSAGKGAAGAPDRVTVYRTLNSLVDAGIAHRVDPGDRVFRFSLTDHAKCTEHQHVHEHPHFVCDSCGKVECLQDAEVVIKSHVHEGSAPSRRLVKLQDVMLHGTCEKCSDGGGKADR